MEEKNASKQSTHADELTLKWYAVYVKPRTEKKVKESLEKNQIQCYLPLVTTLKQWSDRKKKVEEPLFKSYLFVQIDYERDHIKVLTIPGIVTFVRNGRSPEPIRDRIMEAIRISLMHYDDIITTSEQLEINQPVTVIAGPLKGFEGLIAAKHGNRYFAIRIPELGTHVLIKIPAAYLSSN